MDEAMMLRRQLLPAWLRLLAWLFLLLGLLAPLAYGLALIFDVHASYEYLALSYQGSPMHPLPLAICLLATLTGLAAYGLLGGKRWGVDACLLMGYLSLGVVLARIIQAPMLRLEPVILLPYLWRLHRLKTQWLSI